MVRWRSTAEVAADGGAVERRHRGLPVTRRPTAGGGPGTPPRAEPTVLRIGELAQRTGVTTRTLRYWEELGLIRPSGHRGGGERLYLADDMARVTRIRDLQELLGSRWPRSGWCSTPPTSTPSTGCVRSSGGGGRPGPSPRPVGRGRRGQRPPPGRSTTPWPASRPSGTNGRPSRERLGRAARRARRTDGPETRMTGPGTDTGDDMPRSDLRAATRPDHGARWRCHRGLCGPAAGRPADRGCGGDPPHAGWDEASKEITRKFAANGYLAVCPNLYFARRPEPSPTTPRPRPGRTGECRTIAWWATSPGPSPICARYPDRTVRSPRSGTAREGASHSWPPAASISTRRSTATAPSR